MAQQTINLGAAPNDSTGDTLRVGGDKINDNFDELYTGFTDTAYTTDKLSVFAATTSAELKTVISDETGSGALVFANTPTLVTPVLGAATGTSVIVTGLLQAGTTLGISTDVLVARDAAATLAQRNAANAQQFNVYRTWTSDTVYERGAVGWLSNPDIFAVGPEKGSGGGSARAMAIGSNPGGNPLSNGILYIQGDSIRFYSMTSGGNVWSFSSSGHLIAGIDNTYDIGDDQSLFRPRRIYTAGHVYVGGATFTGGGVLLGTTNAFTAGVFIDASAADTVLFQNWAGDNAPFIQIGGTSSAFPGIKRNAAVFEIKLADDSAYAQLYADTTRSAPKTVATLPAAATAGEGSVSYVTDASTTLVLGLGGVVSGGGANKAPVWCDGTNWRYG